MRERREPAAVARDRPPARDRRPDRARRRPRAHRPAVADRERADRPGGGAAGRRDRVHRAGKADGVDPAEQPGAVLHRLEHEPARDCLHERHRPADGAHLRAGAGASSGEGERAGRAQGRRPRKRRRRPQSPAQHAGRVRDRTVARAAGRRLALRPQLPQSAAVARRTRHCAADDDAVLHAGRSVRITRRDGSPGGRHRAPCRSAAGSRVRDGVEHGAAEQWWIGGSGSARGSCCDAGPGAAHLLFRRHGASAQNAQRAACRRPRLHRRRRAGTIRRGDRQRRVREAAVAQSQRRHRATLPPARRQAESMDHDRRARP